MKPDKIKALLEKYYAGESSLEDEDLLRQVLNTSSEVPEELKADAELFAMMNALAEESTDQELDFETEQPKVISLDQSASQNSFSWTARIAAGFSLLVIGVLSGWLIGNQDTGNQDVAALRKDITEMKNLVTLSQLRKESASDRIMATYEFKKLDSANDEILDALINTFNNDENANVKNAAADALYKFGNHDKVRKAFINGMTNQTDPLLQIKLIDMLVGLNEKRALPKLQEMMLEDNQMKVVKQKAAQGIGKLL
jgi:HEAT repeat protein